VSAVSQEAPAAASVRPRRMSRWAVTLALLVLLAGVALVSVAVGARSIALDRVWELIWHDDGSGEAIIVHELRLPRTLLGLLVGSALGVAGALMQGLTRNPLADPGLLCGSKVPWARAYCPRPVGQARALRRPVLLGALPFEAAMSVAGSRRPGSPRLYAHRDATPHGRRSRVEPQNLALRLPSHRARMDIGCGSNDSHQPPEEP